MNSTLTTTTSTNPIVKVFERQVANQVPHSGNLLETVSRAQYLSTLKTLQKSGKPEYADPEALLEFLIQDHKDHAGMKRLYFLHYPSEASKANGGMVEVQKVWENEISDLRSKYTLMSPSTVDNSTLPRLQEREPNV